MYKNKVIAFTCTYHYNLFLTRSMGLFMTKNTI